MIVYKVTNQITNKIYIGKTKYDLEKRKYFHLKNKSRAKFYRALCSYGINNFKWEIVCEATSLDELNELEKYYIQFYNSIENGYNLTKGGDGGDVRSGMKNSEQSKIIVSQKLSGHTISEDTRNKISKTLKIRYSKGELDYKPFDEETINIIKHEYLDMKKSINNISKDLCICNKRIYRYFKNNNIPIRDKSYYKNNPKTVQHYYKTGDELF